MREPGSASTRQRKLLSGSSSVELSHSGDEESKDAGPESSHLLDLSESRNPTANKKQYSVTTDEVRTRFI